MSSHTCPRCGGPVIEIVLSPPDGSLVMRSCSACDAREWSSDGKEIALEAALDELSEAGSSRRPKR